MIAAAVVATCVASLAGAHADTSSADEAVVVASASLLDLDESELEHVLELRRAWGLNADEGTVGDLYRHPVEAGALEATDDRYGGLRLRADELEAAAEHARNEWLAPSVRSAATAVLGSAAHGGTFVEGLSIVVQCVGCKVETVRAAIVDQVPDAESALAVRVVTYPLVELATIQHEVAAVLEAELSAVTTRIDEPTNRVIVAVLAADVALAQSAVSSFPTSSVSIEGLPGEPQDYVDKDDYYLFGVVGGGMSLDTTTQVGKCTSGVPTNNAAYGDMLLTAGHCGSTSSPSWLQGGSSLGVFALDNDSGNFDVGGIAVGGIRPSGGNIHSTSTDYWHPLTFAIGMNGDVTGSTVCQNGLATTGMSGNNNPTNRCGTLTSLTFDPGAGWNPVFRYATMYGNTNDSGATIYWPTIYGYGAVGVLKGGSNPGGSPVWYSHLPYALSAWGLTLKPYT